MLFWGASLSDESQRWNPTLGRDLTLTRSSQDVLEEEDRTKTRRPGPLSRLLLPGTQSASKITAQNIVLTNRRSLVSQSCDSAFVCVCHYGVQL